MKRASERMKQMSAGAGKRKKTKGSTTMNIDTTRGLP
jgi:hypothetical protein